MNIKKYHTVETILKSNIKITKEANSIPLTHIHMTTQFPVLIQAILFN
jgi:hypothetical protein